MFHRSEILSLKSNIKQLSSIQEKSLNLSTKQERSLVTDVTQLLNQNRYHESIEYALEQKSLSVLAQVLAVLSPSNFIEECGKARTKSNTALMLLCTMQQIASGLVNDPSIIGWNIIMYFVYILKK